MSIEYPKVLVVALGRINEKDTANNGLLLRNLFGAWPKDRIAQIYSSDDNNDRGYFGRYYRLGAADRRFGGLFYRLKSGMAVGVGVSKGTAPQRKFGAKMRSFCRRILVDTGIYEVIVKPKISPDMRMWIDDFGPDIVFAQGYNLTFSWLPIMIKRHSGAKLAFLTTDDWPTYLYNGSHGESRIFNWLVNRFVKRAVCELFEAVDIPFAFGQPMACEYERRYKKKFITLAHADDPERFEISNIRRCHETNVLSIVCAGVFNKYRWPLLLDLNEACRLLESRGVVARIAVLAAGLDPDAISELKSAAYVDLFGDPGNDQFPSYLKGADILLLAESFDEGFVSAIKLSVSSKSHLFMLSGKPVMVYGHAEAGVVKYAKSEGWAIVLDRRDPSALADAWLKILRDQDVRVNLVNSAAETVAKFHLRDTNQARLLSALS